MIVTSLGHSCYILEISPAGEHTAPERPVRILADPWLSDAIVGDVGGRFPRVRLAPDVLTDLDAIFISHAHTDHLDPYTLVRLWRELEPRPALLLPESLMFLETTLRRFLPGAEIIYLHHDRAIRIRGVEITGLFSPEVRPTNEDDVMLLLVKTNVESFIAEADALYPFYDPHAREMLAERLNLDQVRTACFMTTKNEGDATMAMVDARDRSLREERLGEELDRAYAEIHSIFAPAEDDADARADLWQSDRVVRLVGGQGITFPSSLAPRWNRVLFPIRLADRIAMEREVAAQYGVLSRIEEFVPGASFHLEACGFRAEPAQGVEILDREEDRAFDPESELFEDFPCAPLAPEVAPEEELRPRVLDVLNTRFLPHLIGARRPPLEHLLGAHDGEYRIRVRYGDPSAARDVDYRISFSDLEFSEAQLESEPDEFYWAQDIADFLDGRCDEFSTICRRPLGGSAQRLWTCLGLPYLNNDLVERKLHLHFERAARGESPEDWVARFW